MSPRTARRWHVMVLDYRRPNVVAQSLAGTFTSGEARGFAYHAALGARIALLSAAREVIVSESSGGFMVRESAPGRSILEFITVEEDQ